MSNELTELEMPLNWLERDPLNPDKKKIAKVGMDVLISDRASSHWGVITKITDAWGGTIFVKTASDVTSKFDRNGNLRTQDAWNHVSLALFTPEEKVARKAARAEEQQRIRKAMALKEIQWELTDKDFISSVYDLAVKSGIIKLPEPENKV